jgi:hypothetical protein
MRPEWRQANARYQYTAIRNALEGHILNAADGINVEQSIARALEFCDHLRDLEPYLADAGLWQVVPL